MAKDAGSAMRSSWVLCFALAGPPKRLFTHAGRWPERLSGGSRRGTTGAVGTGVRPSPVSVAEEGTPNKLAIAFSRAAEPQRLRILYLVTNTTPSGGPDQ